jgi:hypothetical protein
MNSPWREHNINLNSHNAFRLWNGGLFNQLITLEIAVGISYFLKTPIYIHDMRKLPSLSESFENKINYITDFIDTSSFDNIFFSKKVIEHPSSKQYHVKNLMNTFIPVTDGDKEIQEFAEGRKQLIIDNNKFYYFDNNLSYYSIMFYNRTTSFDKYLKQLKFKQEYLDIANKISSAIGEFNGIHLRQTDFAHQIYSVTEQEYDNAINLLKTNKNLVITCTDNIKSSIAIDDGRVLYIDNLIKDNFFNDFKQLSVTSKISFDLICMLVMCNAKDFIGTVGSTYSGLIHRTLNQKNNNTHHWMNMGDISPTHGFPFSWNSYDTILIGKKLWWREWKESYMGGCDVSLV